MVEGTPARRQPLRDANNAHAAQRGRPILGLQILSGFKPAAGGWSGGTVYSPRAGKHFEAALALTGDGRRQLKINAGLLSRADCWTRCRGAPPWRMLTSEVMG